MLQGLISGEQMLQVWLYLFLAAGLVAGIWTGFFKARKIQPRGFKWKILRNEALFAAVNLVITAFILGTTTEWLTARGWISFRSEPAAWWVIALEYVLYFFAFDTYFYWLHRWMHKEPFYGWVHKIHHKSTSPNLLTTLSVSPLESVINGGFVPLFLALFTVHDATMALIAPTNVIMGLYVHSGYEFMPRWWNRSWLTKWFITATFHDQHHRYFTGNFGGYTTFWDRLCGTMRTKFEADFDKVKERAASAKRVSAPIEVG
ncbi:sterol desaturase/sphingolipid hydroxylase (fatty acid hydroxylase superfamily) [Novosphingobium chloroacetimidivorans]|uniref:Sterol desaturase/sphingolipid hydroxylase (Fatty acid hydroxylase superfamily) n=1 Tax=Novosphingobium chloroacetimidivorans TaxID=1428314 RepID=A0A7W7KAH3_9SPHN|nr:sterol desaturase family protein [Novosphingobium chloroacetimidivorans]MBB4859212.1 sterol desaturase/sphingolipid hydroxylase (fatty acid hydroxylase superfamily) [Novosphingobium chloroacetimidivorans]